MADEVRTRLRKVLGWSLGAGLVTGSHAMLLIYTPFAPWKFFNLAIGVFGIFAAVKIASNG